MTGINDTTTNPSTARSIMRSSILSWDISESCGVWPQQTMCSLRLIFITGSLSQLDIYCLLRGSANV